MLWTQEHLDRELAKMPTRSEWFDKALASHLHHEPCHPGMQFATHRRGCCDYHRNGGMLTACVPQVEHLERARGQR